MSNINMDTQEGQLVGLHLTVFIVWKIMKEHSCLQTFNFRRPSRCRMDSSWVITGHDSWALGPLDAWKSAYHIVWIVRLASTWASLAMGWWCCQRSYTSLASEMGEPLKPTVLLYILQGTVSAAWLTVGFGTGVVMQGLLVWPLRSSLLCVLGQDGFVSIPFFHPGVKMLPVR